LGYTHYHYQKPVLNQKKFDRFSEAVNKLLESDEAKQLLALESDNEFAPASVTNQEVRFNGKGEDGHETFLFKRETKVADYQEDKKMAFSFCKTARKPYDKYVVACLIVAKIIFGKDVKISSDGEIENWQEGKGLVEKVMNSTVVISQNKDGNFEIQSTLKETSEAEFIKDITK
jgi:hypothetical protein